MASDDFSEKFQNLNISENKDINILLLGETGVGKSTFINAIANYLHFKTFKKASKADDLLILIPSVITVTNEDFEQVTLTVGSDNNEYQEIGAAGTQDVKTYVFPIGGGKCRLRLIDSPGMGDPRGIEQDDINCENILAYLSQIKELHAICFLMKPTTTRKTILFEYCLKQILSRLDKSASKNIIFIFTNTRGSNYTPGDTLPCLKTIIDDIKSKPPNVVIPLKNNIFSLDNEAFRYLIAMKKGITFNESIQQRFVESWNSSSQQCWRLISYIIGDASHDGLKPHQLFNTMSINEARRIIVQLSQPLADITQLIHDNLRILDRHRANLNMENQSLDDLKKKLYIPIINLEVTQLTQPVTVCTSPKCADMVKVGEVQKWHYRQRCHDPCYLTNVVKEIVGDTNLTHCAAMSGRTCMKCTCDYSVHMHVYYLTRTVDDKIEDVFVKNTINRKEEALSESRRLIQQIDQRKNELEQEREVIIRSTAQFAHFLQHNAISPFNDSYKAYIEYLITREKSLGRNGDPEVIHNLEQLLRQYEEIKATFEDSLRLGQINSTNNESIVTAQTVINTIHNLYKLKHNGKKIHELFKKQKTSRNSEYDKNCEYIHPKTSDLTQSQDQKDKSKKDKKKEKSKTDTEDKKSKKDKHKDQRATDDERRQRNPKTGPPNRNPNPQQRPRQYNQQPHVSHYQSSQWRDPPPPYDAHGNYQQRHHHASPHQSDGDPNVTVKVEFSQPGQDSGFRPANQQGSYYGGTQGSYYGGPGSHYGPSHGGSYGPPPPGGSYGPPPPGGSYGPPPSGGPYGPPQGSYAPPSGPYYGSRSGPYYEPPSGPYHGPPQGSYYPPPHNPSYGPPQEHFQGPPHRSYQRHNSDPHNQGNRGRGFNKRGRGGRRSHSKPRSSKGGKSGNSSRSSDSDSS